MLVEAIIRTITAVRTACTRFEEACLALQQVPPLAVHADVGVENASRIIRFYGNLLRAEGRSAIPILDITTKTTLEYSRTIQSQLCGCELPKAQFVESHMPGTDAGGGPTHRVLKDALRRCELAITALRQDMAELRSSGLPTNAANISGTEHFTLDDATNLKCTTLVFLFKFLTEIITEMKRMRCSRRAQQAEAINAVESQHGGVPDARQVPHPERPAMEGIDLNLPTPEED